MRPCTFVASVCLCVVVALAQPPARAAEPARIQHDIVTEPVYDAGLRGKWNDQGWAPRDTVGQTARIDFSNNGGWMLINRVGVGPVSALSFRVAAPAEYGDFLEVHLGSGGDEEGFVHVLVDKRFAKPGTGTAAKGQKWLDVRIPMAELNPKGRFFDTLVLRAQKPVLPGWTEIAQLAFVSPADSSQAVAHQFDTRRVSLRVECGRPNRAISPLIYGTALNPRKNQADAYQWQLKPSARRWGGNPATRYNWRLGNAWNTAADWFFMNVNYTGVANYSWRDFLLENKRNHVGTAMTVPIMGWVAKDTQSYSYPVSVYGEQRGHFGNTEDVGNGMRPDGKPLEGADPRRTSIPASPHFIGQWVEAIGRFAQDNKLGRVVDTYFLDNEPMLWNSTHHDLHPEPTSYDELVARSKAVAAQIRRADKHATIAGPSPWGWPAYFFSAVDATAGFAAKPDRLAHGDTPLLSYYLQQMHAHEQKTGEQLLDQLDVHYYPEGEGVHGAHEAFDAASAERRIRSTRSLWDPTYKDESWIADKIRLIPRLKAMVAESYPGLKISLGEYNFGGEHHISGALAQAEALGRFGQQGLDAAYYWTYPPDNSAVYHAFRAFRNYDGQGASFGDRSLATVEDNNLSLFASQDAATGRIVAIALNLDPQSGADADIEWASCGEPSTGRSFQYAGGSEGLSALDSELNADTLRSLRRVLPPYSITVFEMNPKP